jgi:hypothetical protein
MTPLVVEQQIGDIRWLVVTGPTEAAFHALGRHAAPEIHRVIERLPELTQLRERTATGEGKARLEAVARASRRGHPTGWLELTAMARGAGVDFQDLLLLTLRGDVPAGDGLGCSDFGWTDGVRALWGHNEDGDPSLEGLCVLLTLRLENQPAVATWWYPGFLPGNTFALNDRGLAWGVDAIRLTDPLPGPGRGFVARSLHRAATLEEAIETLTAQPAAGGFAYFLTARGQSRMVVVEHAGSTTAHDEVSPPDRPSLWHTNHLCLLPSGANMASTDSLGRYKTLAAVSTPPSPDAAWILDVLTRDPVRGGVRATGEHGSALTLCTLVVDLGAGEATLLPNGGRTVRLSTADLSRGDASSARVGVPAGQGAG